MTGLIALLVATSLAAGCGVGVSNRTRLESADVSTGDLLVLASAVAYECEPRDTTAEFWFPGVKKKRCIKARADVTSHDTVLAEIAPGTSARVSAIKYINGIDSESYLVYLQLAGAQGQLIVFDFNLRALLRGPRAGPGQPPPRRR
jgi:hypothetical protein